MSASIETHEIESLLTDFGKEILKDRYLLKGETFQGLFNRVAFYYADNKEHGERLLSYFNKMWFMAATPILANGGTARGLPISCFLNEMEDSLDSISSIWNENVWLASNGGGIGTFIGNVRSINEDIQGKGQTSGVVPFIKVIDSMTLAISQGSLRRGSAAVYMDVFHPEIEEFIDIRRPTGGDGNRRCLNIHHGIVIPDEFMHAVQSGEKWDLKSPATGNIVSTINARDLWIKILNARMEIGEPYLLFYDAVNRARPEIQKKLGIYIKTSNLCSEITLPTGQDHLKNMRTAVCCLSSVNLEYYEEWENNELFIPDIMRFLDNVLTDFIKKAPLNMKNAVYSATRERSIGLGVMGFHSFLQRKNIPMEGVMAKSWNKRIFSHIKKHADQASIELAHEKGACLDAQEAGIMERFSNKIAIAPTASISIISGNTSPGIEPYAANVFTQKTLSGSFAVKNKYLLKVLTNKGYDTPEVWSSIATNNGSVQHLSFLTHDEKLVFKTAFEINPMWLVEHCADRTPYICQSQSFNLFLPSAISKKVLHQIHFEAWKKGCKSLYYNRTQSIARADNVSNMQYSKSLQDPSSDECLSCQ